MGLAGQQVELCMRGMGSGFSVGREGQGAKHSPIRVYVGEQHSPGAGVSSWAFLSPGLCCELSSI